MSAQQKTAIDQDGTAPDGTDMPNVDRLDFAARFPVVGVGASAGGLDAFKSFLGALPADTGMAFVLIQHLDPLHASSMPELLAGHTRMPVTQAVDGVLIEPDRIYLIPPGISLGIADGRLNFSQRENRRMTFDFFLSSLAKDCGNRSVCIVLSGSGSDGSEGLKAVKEAGGLVVVQQPSEATFAGMPRSAINTKQVDLILPVAEIPAALTEHVNCMRNSPTFANTGETADAEILFTEILDLVKAKTRHDFSHYKTGTLTRRIERRVAMAGVPDIAHYVDRLTADAAELDSLALDLLINVTQFFRDPDIFDALSKNVIPDMIASQPLDRPLRIWVPGCSAGEEAYSLAMLFLEAIWASKRDLKLQVFGSDLDAHSIEVARAGVYGSEIESQVSPERLTRFFSKQDDTYRVRSDLRDIIVFTVQDLLMDPPFSRLDLISCRNVLIYLRPNAQEQIISLFHFALRVNGVLVLGRSETIGQLDYRFEPIGKKQQIFRHVSMRGSGDLDFLSNMRSVNRLYAPQLASRKAVPRNHHGELAQRLLIETYAPAAVLIDARYEGLFYSGPVDRYFKIAPGESSRNILVMARGGLRPKLRAALECAKETGNLIMKKGAQRQHDGSTFKVKIVVQPIPEDQLFLVSFVEELADTASDAEASQSAEDTSRISQLEQELDATRKDLNITIRDLELSNEDLRAVNEEALSINEEFQSTNEELETSKEELQALNEELTVVNTQLQEVLEQQRGTAADLQNILNSSGIATLFLDPELNIRVFTPTAKSLFGIASVDIGRPLADLAQRFQDEALLEDARTVLAEYMPVRREVESRDGDWYIRSILPYRNEGGSVDGVVITFACISEIKLVERKVEAARAYAESIIATVKQPLVVLDMDLNIVSASASFFHVFDVTPEESLGQPFALPEHHETAHLAKFLDCARKGRTIDDKELKIDLPRRGPRTLLFSAREIVDDSSPGQKILISIDDVTDVRAKEQTLAAAKNEAERANLAKSRFLAAASHDLRQPLQTIAIMKGMLSKALPDQGTMKLINQLDKTVRTMSSLLDKLLDINQLEAGVVEPKSTNFIINDLLTNLQSEFEIHTFNEGLNLRVVPCHLRVRSDPRLLEQIIRNMLSNATKYTPQGKILLGCRRRGDHLSIEVWDTGTGIPETELSAIFQEFHQLDNGASNRPKGLGLGLAIVQGFANLLGAPLTVRSRVGSGSVFGVEVPVVKTPAPLPWSLGQADSAQVEQMHPEPSGRRQTILIIEDEVEVRETLKLLLDSHGHRTFVARDSTHALAVVADRGVGLDLILADFNLPGENGLEIIEKIKEVSGRNIPVIMLTGDISAITLQEIAAKGYVHLHKPAGVEALIRNIDELTDADSAKATTPTVFIVDDDVENCESMRDILEAHGHRAEIFTDGPSFLKACSPGRAGCLIADVRIPSIGALQLLDGLAEIGSSLPVIMIAAYGGISVAVNAMGAGAFDFLEKPVAQDELLSSVERALKTSNQRAQLSTERMNAAETIKSLNVRQRQIFDLFLADTPSEEIAAQLELSVSLVDKQLNAIMRKVGAKSLATLMRSSLAMPGVNGAKSGQPRGR
jgi:two-component system CheB/CheR fusion protein